MNNLRVGLIGFGVMGKNHARVLSELPNVNLEVIIDSKISSKDFHFSEKVQFSNEIDFLAKCQPDYLVVSTPTITHHEIALRLFELKVPILIEKPLALDGKAAFEIEQAAINNGTWGAVGHIERFNSAYQEAKKRIESGLIGKILQISTVRKGPSPNRIMDVGVIKDLLTHDIDSVRWITNDDYSTVSAHKLNIHPMGHEDAVIVVARMRSGILINHEVNWISPLKERKTTIYGELGVMVIDSLKAETTFFESGKNIVTRTDLLHFSGATTGEVIQFSFDKHEPLRVEHENFRDRVLGKESEDTVFLSFARRNVDIADEILSDSAT